MLTPTFTRPPSIADLSIGPDKPSVWNTRLEPIYDFIDSTKNMSIVTVTGNYTVPDSTVGIVLVDASASNVVITLPSPANRLQPIIVKKIDSVVPFGSAGLVTIAVSLPATHRIEEFNSTSTTATAIVLNTPNELVEITDISTTSWRVINYACPELSFFAEKNTSQAGIPITTETIVNFASGSDTENDPYNLFDKSNSRWTIPSGVKRMQVAVTCNISPSVGNTIARVDLASGLPAIIRKIADLDLRNAGVSLYANGTRSIAVNVGEIYTLAVFAYGTGSVSVSDAVIKVTYQK